MTDIADAESALWDISESIGLFGVSSTTLEQLNQELASIDKHYDELLADFEAIECPREAIKLREYTIDIINYRKQAVNELTSLITTGDTSHYDINEDYRNHPSEISLDGYGFDFVIENSGTLGELYEKSDMVMQDILKLRRGQPLTDDKKTESCEVCSGQFICN